MRVVLDDGRSIDLGETEATPTVGIVDYSRRETDDFGMTTVVQRGFARTMSVRLIVPFDQADALQRTLASLRATPAQWIADERFAWLNFRGFFKDFEIDLAVPPVSYCTLTVEGLAGSEPFADPGTDPAPIGETSSLQLLQPIAVTPAILSASSIPENDYAEWSAGVTYPLGARVIMAATHRIYESGAAGNVGNDPSGTSGKWRDVGPTNRWAMFDQALGSVSTATNALTVVLAASTVDALALLDVTGTSVRVESAGYDRTLAPNASGTVTFLDLPRSAAPITVTVNGNGAVGVGTLLIGKLVALGATVDSPKASITDFSRKEADEFGDVQVVERAWAKRMSVQAMIQTEAIDVVAGRIAAVRATPSLWIGKDGLETLTAYGFFKDFSIARDTNVSRLSLSVEGLSTAGKVEPLVASVDWPDIGDPIGTKPQDNADVTGENTSKDTDAVGGKPASEVLDDLAHHQQLIDDVNEATQYNTQDIIENALRQDDAQRVLDARTYVDGQPVNSVFEIFRNEQVTANSVVNSILTLLGAKTPDGTAYTLNLDTVQITPDMTFAQYLTEVGAVNAANDAKVALLMDTVVGPAGGTARVLMTAELNGTVARMVARVDNGSGVEESLIGLQAGKIVFLSANGESILASFEEDDGGAYIPNLKVDRITVGAMDFEFNLGKTITPTQVSQVFPGGLIMKSGRLRSLINDETSFSIVFDEPFPGDCRSFIPVPAINAPSNFRDLWIQLVGIPTRFGATIQTQSSTSNNNNIDGLDWTAWGT